MGIFYQTFLDSFFKELSLIKFKERTMVKLLLIKKWGILIKKESESRIVTGLEISRVYFFLIRR